MLTVAILINGNPIVAKNAVNQRRQNENGETEYKTDSGEVIWHDAGEGAIALAHKLLDTIRNDNNEPATHRRDVSQKQGNNDI